MTGQRWHGGPPHDGAGPPHDGYGGPGAPHDNHAPHGGAGEPYGYREPYGDHTAHDAAWGRAEPFPAPQRPPSQVDPGHQGHQGFQGHAPAHGQAHEPYLHGSPGAFHTPSDAGAPHDGYAAPAPDASAAWHGHGGHDPHQTPHSHGHSHGHGQQSAHPGHFVSHYPEPHGDAPHPNGGAPGAAVTAPGHAAAVDAWSAAGQPLPQAPPGASPEATLGLRAPLSPDPNHQRGRTAPPGASPRDGATDSPRQRGGSPIVPPGLAPAALTALLALLLAGAARLGGPALAVAVLPLQAVTAAGWFRLNGMWPARQGIALAFLAGVATTGGLLVSGAAGGADGAETGTASTVALGALGVWCVLTLVLQLRNRSGPDERLYALTATLTSSGLAVLAAGHLAAEPDAVTVGAAAAGAAALARALPLPGFVTLPAALLVAAGAGAAAGQLTDLGTAGAALGAAAGVCAVAGLRVASYDFPSRFVHMTAGVALPLTLAAPAVYLLGRALA